jgi:S1-C subfamily serine protease
MYDNGHGVIKDLTQAYKWFNIASANGYANAGKARDKLEKRITPFERVEGQRLAREWMERQRSGQKTQIAESQPPKSKNVSIATGSGFLFGSQDYIITNYHVVKGTSELKVKFLNEEMIDATIVAKDTQNDVAILKISKSPSIQTSEIKFADSSMVRMVDEVFTIGYPSIQIMGLRPKYTRGEISALTGIKDDPTVFQTSVPIQPGNSGGPLFNEKGEVIGLTTASL